MSRGLETGAFDQAFWLGVLARADALEVKAFTDGLLPALEPLGLEVLENRTGLVMLPSTDTAKGSRFHLGEVLASESRVRLAGVEGYAVCLGRDLEHSLAVAILDAALQTGLEIELIQTFVRQQAEKLEAADQALLRRVEQTRVEMETF
ncbi:phosphonate C-P lyase system protein PhnG [uncultured Meiothermus sp.]|jgi:alpha-D-ribose 1-methylphosphonate 5-triphosphate synthase subunit PhnG|uniref:phosphonate C-P lyase system protein PhnG n=1 Tax=uncultured Meiothermus sp. TaxID=157471 RepID=UPI002606394B|nr:phosphonate C-P lyase system protein PhnG [uncultured Meiothermus sp.]